MADAPTHQEVAAALGSAIIKLADRAASESVSGAAQQCADAVLSLAQAAQAIKLDPHS